MSSRTLQLTDQLYDYLLSVSLREPAVMKELWQVSSKLPAGVMVISPEQAQFIQLLIQLMGAKKTLEVGTFTGYSALAVALALPEDGQLITCDIDAQVTTIAQEYWQRAGVGNKIKLHLAPALDTLDQLLVNGEAGSFDFVFIDGDKKNYPNYYEKALQLLRTGGLVAIDNVLWSGKVADQDINDDSTCTIRQLNAAIKDDQRVSISMLPLGDGLTLARKL